MTDKIRPCSLCAIRPRSEISISDPDLCWTCVQYQDWERVHEMQRHYDDDAPTARCPVCALTPPPWIVASTPQRERTGTSRATPGTRGTHGSCHHDATPSARRQCRRQRARSTA